MIEQLYNLHGTEMLKSSQVFLNQQDAEDICSELWLQVFTNPPLTIDREWLLTEVKDRARKRRNQLLKASHNIYVYTESPMPIKGEISVDQLEKICLRVSLPEVTVSHKMETMKELFYSLPTEDQQFLIDESNTNKIKDLSPKYGSTEAIYKRSRRLKTKLKTYLKNIYGRKH